MSATWIAFHITDRCQLNCDHCLRDPGQKALDIELSLVERVLDLAVAQLVVPSVRRAIGPVCAVLEGDLTVVFKHNGAELRLFGADNPDAMRGLRLDGLWMHVGTPEAVVAAEAAIMASAA